jgi:WD repeat-containing protein 17
MTLQLWNTDSMDCKATLPVDEGLVYSLSWAPGDSSELACGTSKGSVVIWDTVTAARVATLTHHGFGAVYRVHWHPNNPEHVLTVGNDCQTFVVKPNGAVVWKHGHPGPVYGCSWSPFNPSVFATSCHDGSVRVFALVSRRCVCYCFKQSSLSFRQLTI